MLSRTQSGGNHRQPHLMWHLTLTISCLKVSPVYRVSILEECSDFSGTDAPTIHMDEKSRMVRSAPAASQRALQHTTSMRPDESVYSRTTSIAALSLRSPIKRLWRR